jgi:hypothetical protein
MKLHKGDKIISNKYGPGVVTGESVCEGGVTVDYPKGLSDCVYHKNTGQRHPKCGSDQIERVEEVSP